MIQSFLGFALKEKLTLKLAWTVLSIHPYTFFVLSTEFRMFGGFSFFIWLKRKLNTNGKKFTD